MESGPPSTVAQQLSEADEDQEIAAYRSVSALAVISLIIGVFAPLCFAASLLWAVPIVGIAIAIVSLVRITSSDGMLIGRRAAMIGLALCVASVCAAAAKLTFTERILSSQAQEVASRWFELLQANEVEQAWMLTVDGVRAEAASHLDKSRNLPGRPVSPTLEDFVGDPTVRELLSIGKDIDVHFEKTLQLTRNGRGQYSLTQAYRLEPISGDPSAAVTALWLTMERSRRTPSGPLEWLVSKQVFGSLASR